MSLRSEAIVVDLASIGFAMAVVVSVGFLRVGFSTAGFSTADFSTTGVPLLWLAGGMRGYLPILIGGFGRLLKSAVRWAFVISGKVDGPREPCVTATAELFTCGETLLMCGGAVLTCGGMVLTCGGTGLLCGRTVLRLLAASCPPLAAEPGTIIRRSFGAFRYVGGASPTIRRVKG